MYLWDTFVSLGYFHLVKLLSLLFFIEDKVLTFVFLVLMYLFMSYFFIFALNLYFWYLYL